jgi:hypothetical protein
MALIAMNKTKATIRWGAGVPRHRQRIVMLAVQRDEHVAEVHAAGHHAERRHDESSINELTMVKKAAPMMMPTAMSTTLARSANSLNSVSIGVAASL